MLVHKMLQSAGGSPSDPNFENVTLLLHGDGTNGGQNNTFVDSSTNNFTITRNGNATQGSFSPYGDLWSNYFDGTGDYLSVPDNAAFDFGTGDFTFEAWVYHTASSGTSQVYFSHRTGGFGLYRNNAGALVASQAAGADITSGGSISLNAWTHIAVCRSGTTLRLFIDGTSVSSVTNSTNFNGTTAPQIGAAVGSLSMNGYISNLRVIKGTAVYTAAFTPSTTPLTAITNTSLLTCQSNRFVDNSSNNFTITRNGDVSVQRFSPFAPSAAYSTATIGGSGYFDGNGDYLRTEDSTAYDLPGDFTVEGWLYPIATVSNYYLSIALGSENSAQNGFNIFANTTNMGLYANAANVISVANKVRLGEWNHFAVSRSGTTLRFFLNGVQEGSATNSTSFTGVTGNGFGVGAAYTTSYIARANGYYSDVRLVKGTALYTSNFTPPTAPLTAITNTSLLLNFTNAAIFDNAMMVNLETVGNAQISTVVKKYGTGSLAFDGSGDWLSTPSTQELNFGTGDFTVECWVWIDNTGNPGRVDNLKTVSIFTTGSSTSGADALAFSVYGTTSAFGVGLEIFQETPRIAFNAAATVATNAWTHVAWVRSGSTFYAFVNGTRYTLGTSTSTVGTGTTPTVGKSNYTSYPNVFKGYIDDLRITKGVARYTGNFTPPAAPFPNK